MDLTNLKDKTGNELIFISADNLAELVETISKETAKRLAVEEPVLVKDLLPKMDNVSMNTFKAWSREYGFPIRSFGIKSFVFMSEVNKALKGENVNL